MCSVSTELAKHLKMCMYDLHYPLALGTTDSVRNIAPSSVPTVKLLRKQVIWYT